MNGRTENEGDVIFEDNCQEPSKFLMKDTTHIQEITTSNGRYKNKPISRHITEPKK